MRHLDRNSVLRISIALWAFIGTVLKVQMLVSFLHVSVIILSVAILLMWC